MVVRRESELYDLKEVLEEPSKEDIEARMAALEDHIKEALEAPSIAEEAIKTVVAGIVRSVQSRILALEDMLGK